MGWAVAVGLYQWMALGVRLLAAIPASGWAYVPVRLVLFPLIWLATGALNVSHGIGFLIDECCFRGYRKIDVRAPVMIVGVPRSGTTWLHRVLACDPQMTSLTLWEALLAPSIAERRFWQGLIWLGRGASAASRRCLTPLWLRLPQRLRDGFSVSASAAMARMDAVHQIRLREPEEDFLLLWMMQACFLAVLLCPQSRRYWRLADFDRSFSPRERKRIMQFYHRCLQKHLYVHGPHKCMLSKNPAFTPFVASLRTAFPDVRIVACVRQPEQAVASQFSSLLPAATVLGPFLQTPEFKRKLLDLLRRDYCLIAEAHKDNRFRVVEMTHLVDDLEETVAQLYQAFDLILTPEYKSRVNMLQQKGRRYRSSHNYSLNQFNLSSEEIAESFAHCWPLRTPHAANMSLI